MVAFGRTALGKRLELAWAFLGVVRPVGREFPDVLANTTSAFGLGDWEWILAFEADDLPRLVDCVRRLRSAEARRYTKVEVPFITGIRKELPAAVSDMV
jgi:chlorite dismutase